MKNISKIKKGFNWLACAIVSIAIAFSCLCFSVGGVPVVKAEEPSYSTNVEVADGQFNATGSSVLKGSSSWMDGYIGDYQGNVISGIIDLSANANTDDDFMEVTKLDSYKEFASAKPTTPFGKNLTNPNGKWYAPGTNTKVLMINTNDVDSKRGTAYGFTSQAIDLAANSFYRFTVWAKTGSFKQNRGAVIKLSGFDYDIGFWNIDNSAERDNKDNEWLGFSEYTIYVATAQNTVSATINLQVGDSYTYGEYGDDIYINHIYPSSGYALFDNVKCARLSANAFYKETNAVDPEYTVVHDFNTSVIAKEEKESKILVSDNGTELGSFANGIDGWKPVYKEDVASGQYLYADVYDAGMPFDAENEIGLKSNPYTPRGNSEFIGDRNILVMSAATKANVGLQSEDITIKRNTFYRLSIWASSQDLSDGNASIVIIGENNIPSLDYKLTPVAINDVQGSDDMNARYGWNKYFFYIRGSMAKDCVINLQLWLGYTGNCTGTVMFDEIRMEEVSYAYYNNNSSSGTIIEFDTIPSTTIDNGRFFNAENYGDDFPLRPAQWTAIGDAPESAASGIIYSNKTEYDNNRERYFGVENPLSHATNAVYSSLKYPTMLLLATNEGSYFGYSSPELTISNNTDYKISVTMRTIDMSGAGANLWIEVNGITVTALRNIKSTRNFVTYEFYLQGDTPFSSGTGVDYSAKLNIAMGSEGKKAAGNIYVLEAAMETLAEGEFASKYETFKTERKNELTYDMYSFSALDFFGYDKSDKNAIKQTTSWSITTDKAEQAEGLYESGVFDPLNKENNSGDAYIPAAITNAYNELKYKFDMVYTLQTRGTAVTSQLTTPLKVDADAYYMVTVSMAVILHEENSPSNNYGAGLYFSGTGYSNARFTNIRTTKNEYGEYTFRDYQFYIATAKEDTNLRLNVTLGDTSYIDRYVYGEVYIAYISLTPLPTSADDMTESDTLKIINNHVDEDAEEDGDTDIDEGNKPANDSEKWWLIPSILFGVAIVLAIAGLVIRMIVAKVSRRQRTKQLNSYDRRYGYVEPQDKAESDEFDDDNEVAPKTYETPVVIEQDVDAFNDDEPDTVKEAPVEKVEKPAKKTVESNVNDDFDE